MNKNKGIATIAILGIILGIVVVGGGAYYLSSFKPGIGYYLGNSNGKKEVINPVVNVEKSLPVEEDQNKNGVLSTNSVVPTQKKQIGQSLTSSIKMQDGTYFNIETDTWPNQIVSQDCSSINGISTPIILSPNGGESYIAGQKITVKWKSCVPESLSMGSVGLFVYMQSQVPTSGSTFGLGYELAHITPDDGSTEVILPTKDQWKDMEYGKNFKIQIWHPQYQSIANPMDHSDNSFIINSTNIADSRYVEIKSIYKKNNKYYIDVSYFEIITGEEAYTAQIKEGWCSKKEECISDYYQKNLNENGTLEIDPNVDITVLTYLGSDVDSQYKKLDKFVEFIKPETHFVFKIKIENNKVISMGQFVGN
jgi:hypothetical protein